MSSGTPTAVDALFSKSLSTMVKGIRGTKDKDQSNYIAKCLGEIKKELLSHDNDDKTEALKKLMFLQLLGYDMSWAAFHIIEVMSCTWFGHKREGYLAAASCFTPKTDIALLTTNLFQKALQHNVNSTNPEIIEGHQFEIGAALSCLSGILNGPLANDLITDVGNLTNSSKPYIRRKAILTMLRVFQKYPQGLKHNFEQVSEKLNDDNPSVVAAVVYVLCELASISPKNYLGLAPQFYNILTTSSNNWVLIKVVKLLGMLVPLEPRLAKKLQDPLVEIINTTPAKSLMFECINSLLCGQITSKAVVKLCLQKLKELVESHGRGVSWSDPNLKYLGLLGLSKLIKLFPRVVVEHKDMILTCLQDEDITIRIRALDLVGYLVTQRNLPGVVRHLLEHLHNSEGTYRDIVLTKLLSICSQDSFAYVADFEWYLTCLIEITRIPGVSLVNANIISKQITSLMIRVPELRPFGTSLLCDLIIDRKLIKDVSAAANLIINNASNTNSMSSNISIPNHNYMCEVLGGAALCIGEFAEFAHSHVTLLSCLLLHPNVPLLSETTQAEFATAAGKLLYSAVTQPFFTSQKEAKEWEAQQKALILAAKERSAQLKADGVLPADVDDPYALGDSSDEEEDDDGTLKGGQLGSSGVGHDAYIGRTQAQHITFIEQVFTVVLTGLEKLARSSYAEVQERAHLLWKYTVFVAKQHTSILRINPILLNTSEIIVETTVLKSDTASNDTSISNNAASTTSPTNTSVDNSKNVNTHFVDLTELLFGNDNIDIGAFDPLAYLNVMDLSKPAPVVPTSPTIKEAEKAITSPEEPGIEIDRYNNDNPEIGTQLLELPKHFAFLYPDQLGSVNSRAQESVPLPNGLDLDVEINEDMDMQSVGFFTAETHPLFPIQVPKKSAVHDPSSDEEIYHKPKNHASSSLVNTADNEEERSKGKERLQKRIKEKEVSPYYIGDVGKSKKGDVGSKKGSTIDLDLSEIGKKVGTKRMTVNDGGSDDDDDDDLFEGTALAKKHTKKKPVVEAPVVKAEKKSSKKDAAPKESNLGMIPASEPLPLGILTLHDDAACTITIQTRPIGVNEGRPELLIAVTVEPKIQIPMMQVCIKGNKKSTTKISSIKQPSQFTNCIMMGGAAALQIKGLTPGKRIVGYIGAEWEDANISSSSLKFACNLKLVENNKPQEHNLELVLPTSVFIAPTKVSMAEFQTILTNPNSTCKFSASSNLTTTNVMNTLRSIENALHVLLVDAVNRGAGYYGECITLEEESKHVCVYAKSTDDMVSVTIKTSNQALSDKLVKDLERLSV